MVRLVFRPYTQLRRSICTSESLRSSIRLSPDFNLARHSSPSFGSQRVCSCCSARCEVDAKRRGCARLGDHPSGHKYPLLSLRPWVSDTQWLAHMLDSLVRVSRRVGGAADLLATDMQSVPARTLAIRDCLATRRPRSPERGARTPRGTNFTHACGTQPAVRRVKPRRSAAAGRADCSAESLRIPNATAAQPSA